MSIFRSGLYSGKVALVTGGATGIGRAISNELLSLGEFYWNSLQTILLFKIKHKAYTTHVMTQRYMVTIQPWSLAMM